MPWLVPLADSVVLQATGPPAALGTLGGLQARGSTAG